VLAEGSLPIGPRASNGISVTSRTAPLPSSSSSSPERVSDTGNPEAEGRALRAEQVGNGNRSTVPGPASTQSQRALVPTERRQPDNDEAVALSELFGSPTGLEQLEPEEATEETRAQERERLERLSEEINAKINERLTVRFRTDEETGIDLFQLVEQETGEVVRQVPSEELLAFLRKFQDTSGLLFSEQA